MLETWKIAQDWESNWHSNCINSFHEEEKQLVYAEKMGLIKTPTPKTPYNFDLEGKSVLDIGGGAYSLLLKGVNHDGSRVTDPLMGRFPSWVRARYKEAGISFSQFSGEDVVILNDLFDEVWIYNVLEHTYDPKKIIENALELGKVVRIFEWLGDHRGIGHLQVLEAKKLDSWLGGTGKVENINKTGAVGTAYYGVFKGNHYE